MNKVILTGRLTADPIINTYDGFSSISFTLAVDRGYTKKDGTRDTDFIECRKMDNTPDQKGAKFYSTYPKKGDGVVIQGSWRVNVYDGKDGNRQWRNYCDVERFEFSLSNKLKDNSQPNQNYTSQQTYQPRPNYNQNTPQSTIPVTAGKKSSWQRELTEEEKKLQHESSSTYNPNPIDRSQVYNNSVPDTESYIPQDVIPQAFDIGIDMSDEFMF